MGVQYFFKRNINCITFTDDKMSQLCYINSKTSWARIHITHDNKLVEIGIFNANGTYHVESNRTYIGGRYICICFEPSTFNGVVQK